MLLFHNKSTIHPTHHSLSDLSDLHPKHAVFACIPVSRRMLMYHEGSLLSTLDPR